MKFNKYRVLRNISLLVIILFSSCEKVLDLKLDNMEPKIVIEFILTDANMRHSLSISRTKNFEETTTKVPVSGAKVTLLEENGPIISFTEGAGGNYTSSRYRGIPGKTYTLKVSIGGTVYTAVSKMPEPVAIKSLQQGSVSILGESRNIVEVNYVDPFRFTNYYYFRVFVNNVKRSNFYLASDRFNNGKEIFNTLYFDEPYPKTDDVVRVILLTIDENVYRYMFSINQISGSGGPPTNPGNPTSNFDNGALGYFSASTSSEEFIAIK